MCGSIADPRDKRDKRFIFIYESITAINLSIKKAILIFDGGCVSKKIASLKTKRKKI